MKFLPLQSSKLVGIGYDPDSKSLIAQFDADTYYQYDNVSPDTVVRVLFSESVGKAFSQRVEKEPGRTYRRITREDAFAP